MWNLAPLRAIQVFEVLARSGSVAGAADELGITAGAVSQQIHRIEQAVGVRLLERKGRRLELTSWGRLYFDQIEVAFEQLRHAQEVLDRARAKKGLVLSCLPSLASKWIAPLLLSWRARHHGSNVRLIGTHSEPRFGDGRVDFRISYGPRIRRFEHYAELFTDWVVPACSPAFLAQHPIPRPTDILRLPLIEIDWGPEDLPPPNWGDWAASIGACSKGTASELTCSLSSVAIDTAVREGGFVLGQIAMMAEDLAAGRLVIPFDHRLKLPEAYFLAWDCAALDKPLGVTFRRWIVSVAKRQAVISRTPRPDPLLPRSS